MHILNKTNIDFMRWRWHAVALSWLVILAGLAVVMTRGLPRGIEFAGGTSVIMQFDQAPSDDAVRTALNQHYPGGGSDAIVQTYGDPGQRQKMVRVPHVGEESGASLSNTANAVTDAMKAGNLGNFTVVGTEIVGPAVGQELSQRGLVATVLSLVGLLLYIAFRYQLSFAVGAVVATIHDLLIVVAFLAFFRYDLTLNVIAAILTVTGYSTNDTIVIFDRVRENLRGMRRDSLMDVINTSINQTLGRTVLTGGLTLLSVVSLYFFGGEVLRGFAFVMIVGIITGTYSSVFVAAAVVTFWRGVGPTRAAAHAPVPAGSASATGSSQQPTRKAKPQRKARAS
ncbi:MAG TPA: protein translocase subunit SecF [Vicinamibacterales bacterium]|nr:protein translocase subunit SecF [Vicinamibacterales bacterium]